MDHFISPPVRRSAAVFAQTALLALLALTAAPPPALAATPIAIVEYPLTVAQPAHPQILLAVGNSESMDGTLGGAIFTGSGGLGAGLAGLNASSSPVNYTVPAGFTAPVSNTAAGGSAPYTVTSGGTQYDNSSSRLNIAKAAVTSILNNFLSDADFGLMDYQTSGTAVQNTWVYYMSRPGGFTFANSQAAGITYVANPCYNIPLNSANSVNSACQSLSTRYANINLYQWMAIQDSSDEPSINDALYYPGALPPVFVFYGGPTPANPYPPNFTLAQYNSYSVTECYGSSLPSIGGACETPTNAGYVPSSTEVMQVQRGFGFETSGETATPQSSTSWAPVVAMTSAGQSPTQATINSAVAKFTSYLAPETNQQNSSELKAQATQSPIGGLLTAAKDYYSAASPPSSNGCPVTRYVVLVSDGLPTMDLAGNAWPPLGSAAATGFGVTASFNADGSLASTNSQALTDTITALTNLKSAGIKTYIVGLGSGVNGSIEMATLNAMAIAGGTNTASAAQSLPQLIASLQAVVTLILGEAATNSAAAVNSTGINTTAVAYQAKFDTADTYQDWTGDLLAFPINPTTGQINTNTSAKLWSAQTQLDAQNWQTPAPGRVIATWDPVAIGGTAFAWNSSTTTTTGIASSTNLGQALETFPADMSGQDVLNYLRGNTAQEVRNGGQFRNRSHRLGDIVDSAPLYVGAPSGPWQQSSYFAFQASYHSREPLVYVGANDGMLHAFDAATGDEKFAFIPHAVWNNLIKLVNPYYNQQHWFFVDGPPNAADMQFSDGSWHTMLLGGENGGGNSIYALDVSNPSNLTSEAAVSAAVQWEFTDANMGLSYSAPIAVYTAAGFAVVFGNGYNSPSGQPYLYAVNPKTGGAMLNINLCSAVPGVCNASLPNGLSSVTAMNTSGLLSTPSNVLYAGDLQGNLWRVDISNPSPALWTVSVLFQARDSAGNPQPITVAPAVTLNPLAPTLTGTMVYFGTGQLLALSDLGSSNVQSFYGVYDAGAGSSTPLLRANLVQQTMTSATGTNASGATVSLRELSNNTVALPSKSGWYVDFSLLSGERDVTAPTLFNGTVQVTTYQPNPSACTSGGNSFLMVFNYATGGATTLPQFDWAGNNAVTNADLVLGSTVAGVSLGTAYAAAPKLLTGAGGARAYTSSGASEANGTCSAVAGTSSCIPAWANSDSRARGAWQEVR